MANNDPAEALRHRIQGKLDERAKQGLSTYGAPIDPINNSRDWLDEIEDELLDALVYVMAERIRRTRRNLELLEIIGRQSAQIKEAAPDVAR